MSITNAQYQLMLARLAGKTRQADTPAAAERERDLHENILAACRFRGWLPFHGHMAHQTFRTPGEPDFVILGDQGKLFLIEAKVGKGKLSIDQQGIHAWAARLGHRVHVLRSMREFYEIIA